MTVKLIVTYTNGASDTFFLGNLHQFRTWKRDDGARMLTIGHGLPRAHIPFDNIRFWLLEKVEEEL